VTVELLRAPELIEVSAPARLLYLGLRILASDGLVTATKKQLHAAILPGDDLDVGDLLRDLQAAGLVVSTTDPPGWRVRELEVKVAKAKKPVAPVTQEMSKRIESVWKDYVETMGKPRARLDDKRRNLIRKALEIPYTCEELAQAIKGYTFSPFHMGDNDKKKRWDDIELLLRDAQHIDAGLALYENNLLGGPRPPAGALNGGRSRSQGFSPHERWNAFGDRAAGAGGLPRAGESSPAGSADSRRVAAGADARESREVGSGLFDGLRGD
jgi:hypothetical protein